LVPALKGIPLKAPAAPKNPKLIQTGNLLKITWDNGEKDKSNVHAAKYHLIYRFETGEKPDFTKGSAIVVLTGEDSYSIKESNGKDYQYYLSALDRLFCESKPVKVTGR
jgi:hypothetical protein